MENSKDFQLREWFCSIKKLELPQFIAPDINTIQKQRRELSKKYHPDKCEDCGDLMMEINSALSYIELYYERGYAESQSYTLKLHNQFFPFTSSQIANDKAELLYKMAGEFQDCD